MKTATCILLFVLGVMWGMHYASERIAARTCQQKGYTNYEVLRDWSIRCMTIVPLEEPKQ